MKSLRSHRWLAAFTVLLLLMGTAMPALVRMHCLSGGHTVLSLGQADDCCPEDEEENRGPVFRAMCCEFERTAPERTDFTMGSGPSSPIATAAVPGVVIEFPAAISTDLAGSAVSSRPPPLLLAERLSQVGSYLL